MKVLQHFTKEHSQNIIANICVRERKKKLRIKSLMTLNSRTRLTNQPNSGVSNVRISLEDTFTDDLEEDQMCKICTMTEAFGDTVEWLGPSWGLHCTGSVKGFLIRIPSKTKRLVEPN